jgi:hypothetical protein
MQEPNCGAKNLKGGKISDGSSTDLLNNGSCLPCRYWNTAMWQPNVPIVSEALPGVTVVYIILERRRPAFATRKRVNEQLRGPVPSPYRYKLNQPDQRYGDVTVFGARAFHMD